MGCGRGGGSLLVSVRGGVFIDTVDSLCQGLVYVVHDEMPQGG